MPLKRIESKINIFMKRPTIPFPKNNSTSFAKPVNINPIPINNIIKSADDSEITNTIPSRVIVVKADIGKLLTSNHKCYLIRSLINNRIYIGYTVDFNRRIRQHNGEITGGAKKTKNHRPWTPVCIIEGFLDQSTALRFEYRLQHNGKRVYYIDHVLKTMTYIINNGDGSVAKNNKKPWPSLTLNWIERHYIPNVNNQYHESHLDI